MGDALYGALQRWDPGQLSQTLVMHSAPQLLLGGRLPSRARREAIAASPHGLLAQTPPTHQHPPPPATSRLVLRRHSLLPQFSRTVDGTLFRERRALSAAALPSLVLRPAPVGRVEQRGQQRERQPRPVRKENVVRQNARPQQHRPHVDVAPLRKGDLRSRRRGRRLTPPARRARGSQGVGGVRPACTLSACLSALQQPRALQPGKTLRMTAPVSSMLSAWQMASR